MSYSVFAGPFRIYKSHSYYWIATARVGMPMGLAMKLQQKMGKTIRADGDGACKGPETWHHMLDIESGREVIWLKTDEEADSWDDFVMKGIIRPDEHQWLVVRSLDEVPKLYKHVNCYHIDNEQSLTYFKNFVKLHWNGPIPNPTWWK